MSIQNAPERDIPASLALQYGIPTQSKDIAAPSTYQPVSSPDTPKKKKELPITMIQAYLANERTFLAWIRTAISLMALGIAIARIIPAFQHQITVPYLASTTGIAFVILGIATVTFGMSRFSSTNQFLESGKTQFPIHNVLMWTLSGFVLVCAGLSLALVAVTFSWGSHRTS